MNQNDFKQFAMAMSTLSLVFGENLNDERSAIYFKLLSKYSIDDVKNACVRAASELKFFPRPAELIEFIKPNNDIQAKNAWLEVDMAVREHGSYNSVAFSDPLISKVIKEKWGDWHNLCMKLPADESKKHWFEVEFVELYKSYQRTDLIEDVKPQVLTGLHDKVNIPAGHKRTKPRLVGDKSKFENVLDDESEINPKLKKIIGGIGNC